MGKENTQPAPPEAPKPLEAMPSPAVKPADDKPNPEVAAQVAQLKGQKKEGIETTTHQGLEGVQHEARKTQLNQEQAALKEKAKTTRTKEKWYTPNPGELNDGEKFLVDASFGTLADSKMKEFQPKLVEAGFDKEPNPTIIKKVAKNLVINYYLNNNKNLNSTQDYFQTTFKKKLLLVSAGLKAVYEDKKNGFTKQIDVAKKFNEFSQAGILQGETIQQKPFEEFLSLDEASLTIIVESFKAYQEKEVEKKTLEGQIASAALTAAPGVAVKPQELIDKGTITLSTIRYTITAAGNDVTSDVKAEIAKALPPMDNAEAKQKLIDHLYGELEKIPEKKPGETFELAEGKWKKVDLEKEKAAQAEAAKKAAEIASGQSSENPFDFKDKGFGEIVMQLIKFFLAKMGLSGFLNLGETLNDAEKVQFKEFMEAAGRLFSDGKNIKALTDNTKEFKRVLKEKAGDTQPGETWDGWLQRHLTKTEWDDINGSALMKPNDIADKLISKNGPQDEAARSPVPRVTPAITTIPGQPSTPNAPGSTPNTPAGSPSIVTAPIITPKSTEPLTEEQEKRYREVVHGGKPTPPASNPEAPSLAAKLGATLTPLRKGPEYDALNEELKKMMNETELFMKRIESEPYFPELNKILDKYGEQFMMDMMADWEKPGKKIPSGEALLNSMGQDFISKHPEIRGKFKSEGKDTPTHIHDIFSELLACVFEWSLANAKTPEEKQKITDVQKKFNATLTQLKKERSSSGNIGGSVLKNPNLSLENP